MAKKQEVFTTSGEPVKPKEPSKIASWVRILLVILAILAIGYGLYWVLSNTVSAQSPTKGNVCHMTEAEKNPYVAQSVPDISVHVPGHVGDFMYEGPTNDKGKPTKDGDEWCNDHVPTPTPTPTATPTPPQCPTWTCGECEELYPEKQNGLTLEVQACMKEKKYCEVTYGCDWICPDKKECDKEDRVWSCDCPPDPTPTPTPEVTPTPTPPPTTTRTSETPSGCTENCGVPACTDTVPKEVANPHIYRNGDTALVKWMPTEGDKVNIYWKQNSSGDWQYSLIGSPNDGYEEINGLGTMDITFGVQSVNGCAADGIINASNLSVVVDGATSDWILFR